MWECRLSLAVFNQVKFRDGSSCCVVFSSRWNWCSQAVSWMTQGLMCCLFPHLLQWQGTQGCHTDTSCLWYCWRLDAAMICNSGLWPFFLSASAWLVCLTPCSLFPFVLLRHEQRVCAGLQPNEWTSPQRTQRSLMWSQVRLLFLLLCTNFYSNFLNFNSSVSVMSKYMKSWQSLAETSAKWHVRQIPGASQLEVDSGNSLSHN